MTAPAPKPPMTLVKVGRDYLGLDCKGSKL